MDTFIDISQLLCAEEKVKMELKFPVKKDREDMIDAINLRIHIGYIDILILGDSLFPKFIDLLGIDSPAYEFIKIYLGGKFVANQRYNKIITILIKHFDWDKLNLGDIRCIFQFALLTEKTNELMLFKIAETSEKYTTVGVSNTNQNINPTININEIEVDNQVGGTLVFNNKKGYIITLPQEYLKT
jgi:hypothetical protein